MIPLQTFDGLLPIEACIRSPLGMYLALIPPPAIQRQVRAFILFIECAVLFGLGVFPSQPIESLRA